MVYRDTRKETKSETGYDSNREGQSSDWMLVGHSLKVNACWKREWNSLCDHFQARSHNFEKRLLTSCPSVRMEKLGSHLTGFN